MSEQNRNVYINVIKNKGIMIFSNANPAKIQCSDEITSVDRDSFMPHKPNYFPQPNLHEIPIKSHEKHNSLSIGNLESLIKPMVFLTQIPINEIMNTRIKNPLKLGRKITFIQQNRPPSNENLSRLSIGVDVSSRNIEFENRRSSISHSIRKKKWSDYFEWFFSPNITMRIKVFDIFKKLLPPHFVAIMVTVILILMQNQLQVTCWLKENCECSGHIDVRIYSYGRDLFLYWTLSMLFGYYTIFFIKEFSNLRIGKFIFYAGCHIVLVIIYFYPGQDLRNQVQYSYIGGFSFIFLFYFKYYKRLKVGFKHFMTNFCYPIYILVCLFFNMFMTRVVFIEIKTSMIHAFKDQGLNLYQVVCIVYVFFYKAVYRFLLRKYYDLKMLNDYRSYNPIILWIRILLIVSMAMEISNILEISLYCWGGAFVIVVHIFVIIKIYIKVDPVKTWAQKILRKFNKDWLDDDETSLFIDNMISAYMLDFQLIMLPRLLIVYFYRRWIVIHNVNYYVGCNLSISNDFIMFPEMVYLVICINIVVPILIFLWLWKNNKKITFLYKIENFNFFQRTYMIVLMHAYFEMILQDMRFLD